MSDPAVELATSVPSRPSHWTESEDTRLVSLVNQFLLKIGRGSVDWTAIGNIIGRAARRCRDRYRNHLSAEVSKEPWSEAEDGLLREKVLTFGRRWRQIAPHFVGRPTTCLRNRWEQLKLERSRRMADERNRRLVERVQPVLSLSETTYMTTGLDGEFRPVEGDTFSEQDVLGVNEDESLAE